MKTREIMIRLLGTALCLSVLTGCGNAPHRTSAPETTERVVQPTETIQMTTQSVIHETQDQTETISVPKTEDAALAALRQEIRQAGCSVGIAYMGFAGHNTEEKDLRELLTGEFSFLEGAPLADCGGQEVYVMVPADPEDRITIYASQPDENREYREDRENPVLSAESGQAVLLRCNVSDIVTNSLAVVEGTWGSLELRPCLSLRNGRVNPSDGCYDFTRYTGPNPEIAYELLRETEEVGRFLDQGMTVLDTGEYETIDGRECMVFALGRDRDGQFTRERYYAVSDNLIYFLDETTGRWHQLGSD